MNCRPGDLAFIVRVHAATKLSDRIVKLTEEPPLIAGGIPHWNLEKPVSVVFDHDTEDVVGHHFPAGVPIFIQAIADRSLRPIRDPGKDAVDETLIYAGDPCVRKVLA
jgi:hypothetical protein